MPIHRIRHGNFRAMHATVEVNNKITGFYINHPNWFKV